MIASHKIVKRDYELKVQENKTNFEKGDYKSTQEYTFYNQRQDGQQIVDLFYKNPVMRAVSIIKRTKVGMDGLMIELAKTITTHEDRVFRLDYKNVLFLTGMSNVAWERDMKDKIPHCFSKNVYHRGKLKSKKINKILPNFKNGLIIIDEIDTGDDINHVLAKTLNNYGLLDIENMKTKNIRFVFVSATMKQQISELMKWPKNTHAVYKMTIPETYVSHRDLLDHNIIQEFYDINTEEIANKWIKEDIIDRYGEDYRIHIIRINDKNMINIINAAKTNGIEIRLHTSKERIEDEEMDNMFKNVDKHIIIMVKGFYRRANLIPNCWKIKIGAVHELCTNKVDINVQIQGLSGRMTGYWKDVITNPEYKIGPYRTSVAAIQEYEEWFKDPCNYNSKKYYTNMQKSTYVKKEYISNQ